MKGFITMLAALMLALAATCEAAVKVYRIDLDEEIGATTWQFTRAGLQAARERGADLVLVHLNTYGGEVGTADSIRTALLHCGIPTMAFVDNNAASAGALIALACDTVIMRPDATMGAATVVNGTDGQAMPDKYQSYMRGIMRATAESHGKVLDADGRWRWRRDPVIAEAMVDPRVEVDGLIDDTRVLTFTPDEAVRWGYADGKADNVAEALAHIGVESFEIQRYQPTWVDRLTGFFGSPGVQAILIMIIVGGIYFELQTPGMGFPSMAALGAAVLYFLPLYISGVVSSWIVVVFVVGLLLMLLELFVIPGFGIAGIAGGVMMSASLFFGLFENFSFSLGGVSSIAMWYSLGTMMAGVALAIGAIWLLTSRYGTRLMGGRNMLVKEQLVADGYIGVDMRPSRYVGMDAVALTDMRPSGKVMVDGERLDAVSDDGFIDSGTAVRIVRYENAQLYVEHARVCIVDE